MGPLTPTAFERKTLYGIWESRVDRSWIIIVYGCTGRVGIRVVAERAERKSEKRSKKHWSPEQKNEILVVDLRNFINVSNEIFRVWVFRFFFPETSAETLSRKNDGNAETPSTRNKTRSKRGRFHRVLFGRNAFKRRNLSAEASGRAGENSVNKSWHVRPVYIHGIYIFIHKYTYKVLPVRKQRFLNVLNGPTIQLTDSALLYTEFYTF